MRRYRIKPSVIVTDENTKEKSVPYPGGVLKLKSGAYSDPKTYPIIALPETHPLVKFRLVNQVE